MVEETDAEMEEEEGVEVEEKGEGVVEETEEEEGVEDGWVDLQSLRSYFGLLL